MNKKFEVGKRYECANFHMHPITVISRTKKNVTVFDGAEEWDARTYLDNDGDEYIQKRRGIQTYSASWEIM